MLLGFLRHWWKSGISSTIFGNITWKTPNLIFNKLGVYFVALSEHQMPARVEAVLLIEDLVKQSEVETTQKTTQKTTEKTESNQETTQKSGLENEIDVENGLKNNKIIGNQFMWEG